MDQSEKDVTTDQKTRPSITGAGAAIEKITEHMAMTANMPIDAQFTIADKSELSTLVTVSYASIPCKGNAEKSQGESAAVQINEVLDCATRLPSSDRKTDFSSIETSTLLTNFTMPAESAPCKAASDSLKKKKI